MRNSNTLRGSVGSVKRFESSAYVRIGIRFASVVLLILAVGCSTTQYKERADREVYQIIEQKTAEVPGMLPEFTIDRDTTDPLTELPSLAEADEFLGEAGAAEVGAQVISLEKALHIAVTHNRTYQTQKELLYLQALQLTLQRHRFDPIFSAGASGSYNRSTTDVQKMTEAGEVAQLIPGIISQTGSLISTNLSNAPTTAGYLRELGVPANAEAIAALEAIGTLSGTPAQLLNDYASVVEEAIAVSRITEPRNEIMNERSVDGVTSVGVSMLLKGGAQIAVGLTSNFLRFLTGDPRVSTSSALVASITQPILRGRGSLVTAEALTQAERNVLYQLRSFTRFRQEFAVQVASSYYDVLRARDTVRNNWQGYQAFLRSADRERALAEAGRQTVTGLGRIEQEVLNAENSWVDAVRNYKQSLDQFKILLGLSTDAAIVLDENELTTMAEVGLTHPSIAVDDAVAVGLVARLDLYNVHDERDDAERRIRVAANALKPDLDLIVTGQVNSEPGEDTFQNLDFQRARWSAGFDLDLPLDRKAERNSYRSALIDYDQSIRELTLAEDNVKLDVRQAWRNLDQAKRNYENRQLALQLAASRVEEQNLRAELGGATIIDLVDAQNDYINAQNQLTDALVRHTIARLQFWRDMGILYIKPDGQWEEVNDVPEIRQPATAP